MWLLVPAWLVAWRFAWTDPIAGALATWLAIATAGVVRYYASATGHNLPGVGPLTAYPLALPSYLVVAWACGRGFRPGAGRLARAAAVAGCAAAALPLAAQLVTGRYETDLQTMGASYYADVERCTVVKAAGAYVREQAVPGAIVFHLSESMMLGVIGEFYYGLSYVGNNHTGERNRIVDFGTEAVKRRATPEQWAGAYGVPHFTYYVEFLPNADATANSYIHREGFFHETNWDVLLELDWPIFEMGKSIVHVRLAQSRVRESEREYADARDRARTDVEAASQNLLASLAQIPARETRVRSSEENVRLLDAEYRTGIATNLEAVEAENTRRQARLDLERELYNARRLELELRAVSGDETLAPSPNGSSRDR